MARYTFEGVQIPVEWCEELLELVKELQPKSETQTESAICYKTNQPCKYGCLGLCKES